MNTEPAIADDLVESVESDLAAIVLFTGATRQEPAIVDGEYQTIEQFLVPTIERDVYNNCIRGGGHLRES